MKEIKKEVVIELVEEVNKKLRELDRMFMNDEFEVEGDEIVENFYYDVKELVG